jgi:hypothetical protein
MYFKKNKILSVGLLSILLATYFQAVQASTTQPLQLMPKKSISETGQRAFQDLARCINSPDASNLNIFYLVDSSSSLSVTDEFGEASDPNDVRAQVLAQSLEQLAPLNKNIKVSFALSTFDKTSPGLSPGYPPVLEWAEANSSNISTATTWVKTKIPELDGGGGTNWEAGLENAAKQLSNAPRGEGRNCDVIIWFTDGAISVGGSTSADAGSIQRLCGLNPTDSSNGISKGLIPGFRSSGITLIGILLDPKSDDPAISSRVSYMLPLVESSGQVDASAFGGNSSQQFQCGVSPVPQSHAAGALLTADNPDALAAQFAALNALVRNGAAAPVTDGKPNRFVIDKGISSFDVVIPDSTWTLMSPNGSVYDPKSSSSLSGYAVATSGGVSTVTVQTKADSVGEWAVTKSKNDLPVSVYLFSGLQLKLNDSQLEAGKNSQPISGSVVSTNGSLVDLSVYQQTKLTVQSIDTSGNNEISQPVSLQLNDNGTWSGSFNPFEGVSVATFNATLELVSASGVTLAPVSGTFKLPVLLSEKFPQIKRGQIKLTDLIYKKSDARGVIDLIGPKNNAGRFKIGNLSILNDPVPERSEKYSYAASINGKAVDSSNWIDIAAGEKIELAISLDNSVPADGQVLASLPISFQSDAQPDQEPVSAVEISFLSQAPKVSPLPIVLILFVLGAILPFLLLYLMNKRSAKLKLDNLRIARVPIYLSESPSGIVISPGVDMVSLLVDKDFEYLPTDLGRPKKYDFGSESLISQVPKNPFGKVAAIVTTSLGNRIISSEDPVTIQNGIKAGAPLNPNRFFFVVIPTSEIEKYESDNSVKVSGLLTAFSKLDPISPAEQLDKLVAQIQSSSSWDKLSELKSKDQNEIKLQKQKKTRKVKSEADQPSEVSQVSTGDPWGDTNSSTSTNFESKSNLPSNKTTNPTDDPWA